MIDGARSDATLMGLGFWAFGFFHHTLTNITNFIFAISSAALQLSHSSGLRWRRHTAPMQHAPECSQPSTAAALVPMAISKIFLN
jgi:hypothetical protein